MTDPLSKQLVQILGALESLPPDKKAVRFFVNKISGFLKSDEVVAFDDGNLPVAISELDIIESKAPHIQRLSMLFKNKLSQMKGAAVLEEKDFDPTSNEFSAYAIWMPYATRRGGILALRSSKPYSPVELAIGKMCVSTLETHTASPENKTGKRYYIKRKNVAAVLALISLASLSVVKVPDMTLVSAEITSINSRPVRTAVSGVVEIIHARDGQRVAEGETVIALDTQQISAQIAIARAEAEHLLAQYEQAVLASIEDVQARLRMRSLYGELEQKLEQIEFLESQRDRHYITAQISGILDMESAEEFVGVPVNAGQQLATLVDPSSIDLTLEMPVAGSTNVNIGNAVAFFPYSQPWNSLYATVQRVSLAPELNMLGEPVYFISAEISEDYIEQAQQMGVGSTGRARIDSEPIALGLYALRRPMAWLRQVTGL